MPKCQGGCSAIATQTVVNQTEMLHVCSYCAVSLVDSGYRIAAWRKS